jgi:hypothetical protein
VQQNHMTFHVSAVCGTDSDMCHVVLTEWKVMFLEAGYCRHLKCQETAIAMAGSGSRVT